MANYVHLSPEEQKEGIYLLEQCMGFVWQAALRSVVQLNIADYLQEGGKTAEQLGQELNVDSQYLHRVMRIVASRNVFNESAQGVFTLTPTARFLCSDHSHSLRNAVSMLTDDTFWQPAGKIESILRGTPVFHEIFGMPFYDYWAQYDTSAGENVFHAGMSSMSGVENEILADSYEFPDNTTVVDIAGGYGNLLLAVLQRHPSLHGILFDQEKVLAANRLHLLGDKSRWQTVAGSFFEACPTADFYLLKYILMDWSDAQALQILSTCRQAMKDSSRLLILEPIMKDTGNEEGRFEIDLLLLTSFDGGRTRTEKEYSDMLFKTGLKINRVIHTQSYLSIIEAVPA